MALAFFEGYIRNRGPLCRELGLPEGAPERTVLEEGYRRWGKDLPGRLYGAFALVFHNPEDNSFFCVRDQIGLQPFFYCVTGNREFLYGCDLNELIRDSRYHRAGFSF